MKPVLLHPSYFPSIAHFVAMLHTDAIIFEAHDNYQKQTYRNRTLIFGANGPLGLNIPIIYSQKNRQRYKDVEIFNSENWQSQHLKSIESAYSNSPFFEFYIDDLLYLFEMEFDNLLDLNLNCIAAIYTCLQLEFNYTFSKHYETYIKDKIDARPLVVAKKGISQNFLRYPQVFEQKHGFISNLSILDLLFNEGPNAETYLKNQTLHL